MNKSRRYSLALATLFSLTMAAQGTFPGAETILYEAPEGTEHANQVRNATSFYDPGEGVGYLDSVSYYVADYVEAADGSLYLKNPFTFFPSDTWLRLDREADGGYTAHLPQAIYEDEDGTVFYARRMVFADRDGEGKACVPDEAEPDVRFVWQGDALTLVGGGADDDGLPRYILGLATAKGGWSCYGEAEMAILPLHEQPTTRPESLPEDVYVFGYEDLYGSAASEPVTTFRDGKKLYFELPYVSYNDERYWLEAEEDDGGKLIIKPQYLGVDSWSCLHLFATPALYNPDLPSYEPYELLDEMALGYDSSKGCYGYGDPNLTILVNVGNKRAYYADLYQNPRFGYVPAEASLVSPVVTSVADFDEQKGYGSVEFEFAPFDTHGERPLTKDNLYYRVFLSQSANPYVFSPADYPTLETTMTEVPYYFTDHRDLMYDGGGITAGGSEGYVHHFNFYHPFDSVGIQAIYRDGTPQQSEIVWAKSNSVLSVAAPQTLGADRSVGYTVGGVRMKRPTQKGIVIRRKADGTATKEVVR